MRIGGILRTSLIDYPGKVAAVIFTQGCNFRCQYCYNRELVIPSCFREPIPEEEILLFLEKRKGFLQGVVVSGGEPTMQKDLVPFLSKLRTMGYFIKLDTNGSRPSVIRELLDAGLVDFIALDVKAPSEKYSEVAGVEMDPYEIRVTIDLLLNSGIEYLFRTTVARSLFTQEDILKIRAMIHNSPHYVLQNFQARPTVMNPDLLEPGAGFGDEEFLSFYHQCQKMKALQ